MPPDLRPREIFDSSLSVLIHKDSENNTRKKMMYFQPQQNESHHVPALTSIQRHYCINDCSVRNMFRWTSLCCAALSQTSSLIILISLSPHFLLAIFRSFTLSYRIVLTALSLYCLLVCCSIMCERRCFLLGRC